MPVVAAIYGPEAFGHWSGWLALAGIFSSVACLRYETAIALADSERQALHLALLSLLLSLFSCAIVAIAITAVVALQVELPLNALGPHASWIPIGALILAWVAIASQWLARNNAVRALATAKVWASGVTAIGQITLGALGIGALGLILGDVIGRGAGIWGRMRYAYSTNRAAIHCARLYDLAHAGRQFRHHAAWMAPTAILDAIGQQLPLLLTLAWFGDTVGGVFALSLRLLSLPISLVGQSVAQLYYPMMAQAHRECSVRSTRLFLGLSAVMLSIGLLVVLGANLACLLLPYVRLGDQWRGIVSYLGPVSVLAAGQLVGSTTSNAAIVLGGQRWFAAWTGLVIILTVIGMLLGRHFGEGVGAAWGMAVANTFCYAILWLAIFLRFRHESGKTRPSTTPVDMRPIGSRIDVATKPASGAHRASPRSPNPADP